MTGAIRLLKRRPELLQRVMHGQSQPELAPGLKQLRLSGILDSLAERNRQVIDKKMSYVDFLAMLITDEVARRDHKKK